MNKKVKDTIAKEIIAANAAVEEALGEVDKCLSAYHAAVDAVKNAAKARDAVNKKLDIARDKQVKAESELYKLSTLLRHTCKGETIETKTHFVIVDQEFIRILTR